MGTQHALIPALAECLVSPWPDDGELRLRDWIESNRRYVAEQTGGKIGYIYRRPELDGYGLYISTGLVRTGLERNGVLRYIS